MKHTLTRGLLMIVLLVPTLAFANPILRSGDSVTIGADQVLEGDFYGLGSDITVSGEAKFDMYLAGGTVTVNAPVNADLVILGGTVNIHAPVTDDVRIVGGEVVLGSHVGGDVVVLGGKLKILSTAQVDGDVLYFGGQLGIDGPVLGSVVARGDIVRIDANVGKNVTVTAMQSLALGDRANIEGDLTYKSGSDLMRAQKAIVVGNLKKDTLLSDTGFDPMSLLLPLFAILFAGLTLFMLFRMRIQKLTESVRSSYGILGLIGLGVILGVPLVSSILIASLIGTVIGIALLLGYGILLIVTWVVSGIVFGTVVLTYFTKSNQVTLLTSIVGILAYILLAFIPFVGPLVMIAVYMIVLGGLSRELYNALR